MDNVYLDYNATAPLLDEAQQRMQAARQYWGNPSSPHIFGQQARAALEYAREDIASVLGCARSELIFTSGGSESDNTALAWLASAERPIRLITSVIEHPAIQETCHWLKDQGVEVAWLPVDDNGKVCVEALPPLLTSHTRLLSVMAANNETGVVQPLAQIGELLKEHPQVIFHTDAVQAWGRMPLPWQDWGVDMLSVSAHKLGGPKGIGALVAKAKKEPLPLIRGGRQERNRRAGSEAVMLAAGFAGAAIWQLSRLESWRARMVSLGAQLEEGLASLPGFFINGKQATRLPNTFNGGIEGISAENLVVALDLNGIAISSGSACSSGAQEPSQVLISMGLPKEKVQASVRISWGYGVQPEHIDRCIKEIKSQVKRLL